MSDADTLKAVFEHQPKGWTELVRRHGPAARAVARVVFERYREPAVAADLDEVVSETFHRLAGGNFRLLRMLASPDRLAPTVRALAAWRALGLLRAKYQAFTLALETEAALGKTHVATAVLAKPPEETERAPCLTREEADRLVTEFLAGVGDRQQHILRKRYGEGQRYAEISESEGVPLASVSQILRHERDKLSAKLAQAAPEAGL